jgi:hypothetical protein
VTCSIPTECSNQRDAGDRSPGVKINAFTLVLEEAGLRGDDLQIVGEPTAILTRRDVERLLRSDDGPVNDICVLRQDAQIGAHLPLAGIR